jgi:hypothetical protein
VVPKLFHTLNRYTPCISTDLTHLSPLFSDASLARYGKSAKNPFHNRRGLSFYSLANEIISGDVCGVAVQISGGGPGVSCWTFDATGHIKTMGSWLPANPCMYYYKRSSGSRKPRRSVRFQPFRGKTVSMNTVQAGCSLRHSDLRSPRYLFKASPRRMLTLSSFSLSPYF